TLRGETVKNGDFCETVLGGACHAVPLPRKSSRSPKSFQKMRYPTSPQPGNSSKGRLILTPCRLIRLFICSGAGNNRRPASLIYIRRAGSINNESGGTARTPRRKPSSGQIYVRGRTLPTKEGLDVATAMHDVENLYPWFCDTVENQVLSDWKTPV